ncbi:UDP-N-acetylmuramate--alanine ligase [Legionella qingyii]|uniref:Gamma-glutamylcyclotransferase n=1 Tax=Legionella qingyii TaxID=2184757 RepID=A0A317U348_9GAMM|nr:gamma-glutamylcyclotransferase family protein [Legionella qingyii]PWY55257.1 UDP-N-acetylmuramate--alanine ligase [Legionella qingyii]RUR22822.1 gamma-glutamylcyclotransferase [Legionella qingyii]RUR23889.1 gamma-glutamylcyclotransferase [Legionella qingyii]
MNTEKLFSYGTLRYEAVQMSNFGRKLQGAVDSLPGFGMSKVKIKDPCVIAMSGEQEHPIITYTGRAADNVEGMVFDVSTEELEKADSYEVADYKRVKVKLASGVFAWVYVHVESIE